MVSFPPCVRTIQIGFSLSTWPNVSPFVGVLVRHRNYCWLMFCNVSQQQFLLGWSDMRIEIGSRMLSVFAFSEPNRIDRGQFSLLWGEEGVYAMGSGVGVNRTCSGNQELVLGHPREGSVFWIFWPTRWGLQAIWLYIYTRMYMCCRVSN